jgi:serine/tyrosine/threonine adenylyltransferase
MPATSSGNSCPQLGDGRAILLGEVIDRHGVRRDIQLKGCGRTPFSRNGDGRAALGPVLREYIVSEAMAALGIATTRALAAVTTGEEVVRESYVPGAVLTRVAASHIRVGTFEYFAARGDVEALQLLADHAIARHYPDAAQADRPYRVFLEAVIARQADLIPRWLLVGFIHGVMNTDNTSIAGETIDFGPCAFLDSYDPAAVFSSIDQHGRPVTSIGSSCADISSSDQRETRTRRIFARRSRTRPRAAVAKALSIATSRPYRGCAGPRRCGGRDRARTCNPG